MSTETVSHLQEELNPLREAAGAADEERSVAVDVSNVQLGSSVHQQLHRLVKGQTILLLLLVLFNNLFSTSLSLVGNLGQLP